MTGARRTRASAPLWGALLLSAGAWSVHLLASQFLVEAVCVQGAIAADARGSVRLILALVTVAAAVVAFAGVLLSSLRRGRLERRGPGLERESGLAVVMMALSAFFTVLIVVEALPLLFLGCGGP